MEKSQTLFIFGGIVVVVVVLVVIAYLYFSSKENPHPNPRPPPVNPKPKPDNPKPKPDKPKPKPKPGFPYPDVQEWKIYEDTFPIINDPENQRIVYSKDENYVPSVSQCRKLCEEKKECDVFSYFEDGLQNCQLFKFKDIPKFIKNINAKTYVSQKLIRK